MTTASWSSRVRHDSDATYQEWRDEFITKLGLMVAAGTLAANETNITPAAGARPGLGVEQGYAVYHLADSLHATAPIYIRFGFGTDAGNAQAPRVQMTVGTSTNGSGVLGGTALSTIRSFNGLGAQTTDTARQSYMCAVAGFFGVNWKVNSGGSEGAFFICRTCDNNGAPTVLGAAAHWGLGTTNTITATQAFRYTAAAAAYTALTNLVTGAMCFNVLIPSNSNVGTDIQVFLAWTITPRMAPLFGVCGVYPGELSAGGTFTATLVGSTPRTFLTWGPTSGPAGTQAQNGVGGLAYAMLWE